MENQTLLYPRLPYDFDRSLSILQRLSTQVVDYYDGQRFRRVLDNDSQPALIEVAPAESGTLKARVIFPPNAAFSNAVLRQLGFILGLDFDLLPFYALLDEHQETRQLKTDLFGLKPPRSASIFETLVVAITEQQVSLSAALAIRKRINSRFGTTISVDGDDYHGFPESGKLAAADAAAINQTGLVRSRSETLVRVARLVESGELDLTRFPQMESDEIIAQLTRIKGIGPWTAKYVLGRGMGRYEHYVSGDVAVRAGVRKYYGKDRITNDKDVDTVLSQFNEYKGYAAFYFSFAYAYDRHPLR
ncbi:MAG: DNA-3-methyladenine glycosylase 2 family protein [Anaerolineaceae bacterium]|nr:DNA-3-methyladenine glycosylase 2 family protein [Anaerolineaceae bacterium]